MDEEYKTKETEEIENENEEDYKVELVKSESLVQEKEDSLPAEELEELYDEEDEGQLAIDVYKDGDTIVLESPIAGVRPDDLDISVTTDSVTIKGARSRDKEVKDEDYFYQECYWGRFSRSVVLPEEVEADRAEATVKNGVLTIKMPRLRRQKSKKLKVKAN